jgi:hypothetical protein
MSLKQLFIEEVERSNAEVLRALIHAHVWHNSYIAKEEALWAVPWVLRQLCPTWMDVFHAVLEDCLDGLPVDAWKIKK